jgi:hypothetical protein
VLGGEWREGAGRLAEVVVEPDAGGEREQFGRDPRPESVEAAGAVAFEAEAVLERPEDGLDALADPRQRRTAMRFVLRAGLRIRAPKRSATWASKSRPA